MSKRNEYDYYELDNFDDGYDSRDYRRRQPERRQSSYNGRSVYNVKSRNQLNKTRIRNRILIINSGILIIILIIVLLSVMVKGCSSDDSNQNIPISTDTISKQNATNSASSAGKNVAQGDLSPTYFKTPEIEDNNANGEMMQDIYVWNSIGYKLFESIEQRSDERAVVYAETINGFADKLSGIRVYDMVIPNQTEMTLPQRLKDSDAPSVSQAENIKSIYSNLNDKVTPINAYNYLADHNKEYIYFNSDNYWTGLGAYYAYSAFAESTDQSVLSLTDCTENTIESFTGTFMNTSSSIGADTVHYWGLPYEVTMDITDADGTVSNYTSPYYEGAQSGSLAYDVFIMGDNPLTVLKSNSGNATAGKKIAVVKESNGNAFVPYLTYNYGEVHVIDYRTYKNNLATYCQQNGIEEVLFLNGILSANTQYELNRMNGLFD